LDIKDNWEGKGDKELKRIQFADVYVWSNSRQPINPPSSYSEVTSHGVRTRGGGKPGGGGRWKAPDDLGSLKQKWRIKRLRSGASHESGQTEKAQGKRDGNISQPRCDCASIDRPCGTRTSPMASNDDDIGRKGGIAQRACQALMSKKKRYLISNGGASGVYSASALRETAGGVGHKKKKKKKEADTRLNGEGEQ